LTVEVLFLNYKYNIHNYFYFRIKQEKVLLSNEGPHKNIIQLSPPMCFTCDNAQHVVQLVDKYLREIESGTCPDKVHAATGSNMVVPMTELHIPFELVTGDVLLGDDDEDSVQDCIKRQRFEDID
jgi:hypothetical protein